MAGSKERERRRARERYEQQRTARVERQRRNRKRAGIGLAVICVLGLIAGVSLALVAGGGKTVAAAKPKAKVTASATASPTTSASAAAVTEPAQHCSYSPAAAGSTVVKASLPTASPDYKAAYTASINTNLGAIKIDLANSKATCTVNSFVHLASVNFWNNTQCHRVSDSNGLYMLQCGDPTAKASQKLSCSSTAVGTGSPGYEFASENLTGATYPAGTVAMANSSTPDSNGSQFFLVFKDTTLGPDYTPFGTITSGLDILQNVAKAGTSCTFAGAGGGVPKDKVIIDSVSINKT